MTRFLEDQVGAIAPPLVFLAETAAALAAVLYASRGRAARRRAGESLWVRFARRRGMSIAAVTLGVLAARLALLPVMPPPEPVIMDEFSYLLGAGTFASGRLANPVHPFWKHFETFYVLQQPSYASMYPPGSALFMAAGQVVAGHPWAGVVLATALMCGAITWMLQGWMPPQWALTGGVIAALRIGIFSYWMNSYWGGSVPAIAGALVLGAVPRLTRRPRPAGGIALGAGIMLLANTRPYEGFVTAAVAGLALAARWVAQPQMLRKQASAAAAASLLILAGGAWMAYYNQRVTGNPLRLPYSAWEAQYRPTSNFLFEPVRPVPAYNHKIFRDHYELDQVPFHRRLQQPAQFIRRNIARVRNVWLFYYGPVLTIPLAALPWMVRGRNRVLVWAALSVLAAGTIVFAPFPHYFAPVAGALAGIAVLGLRHLRAAPRGARPFRLAMARAVPLALAAVVGLGAAAQAAGVRLIADPNPRPDRRMTWLPAPPGGAERASLVRRLTAMGGAHLVFVRYSERHDPMFDWVYNSADPDRSPVIFAREMTCEQNRALMSYYAGRRVWIVEPDTRPVRLASVRDAQVEPAQTASAEKQGGMQ